MSRIILFLFGFALLAACNPTERSTASLSDDPSPPNVILVITDDQGYGDIAVHGNPIIQTPNLDVFYKEAVRFTDYHVSPTCAPTRSALLTGRYTDRTGCWHTIGGWSLLREGEKTLGNMFSEAGYATGAFGKWHLGDNYPYRPFERGFQETVMHGGGGVQQTPDFWGNDYFDDTYFKNGKPTKYEGYCTDVFFNEALDFIDRHKEGPFFCYIATNAPHGPFNVPTEYMDLYAGVSHDSLPVRRKRFYGMITNIDENFGKLRTQLQEWGIADNTILIYTTDNGTAMGFEPNASEGYPGFNAGMRGRKGSEYEGGHRVPFFIYWKDGEISGGTDLNELTAHIDILPTLAELCQISLPEDHLPLDGKSLVPLLTSTGADWEDRMLVTDSQREQVPARWRKTAVMSSEWRLINGEELYNIKSDPGQEQDLADENPEQVARMIEFYNQWWESVSVDFGMEVPIKVGAPEENPVTLTCHDWHAPNGQHAWNQIQIRNGNAGNGYWRIEVMESGTYAVRLRRYPIESGLAIHATVPGTTQEDFPGLDYDIPEGKVMQFTEAYLKIGDTKLGTQKVADDAGEVVFNTNLEEGSTTLTAGFLDKAQQEVGAYYVYLEKLK